MEFYHILSLVFCKESSLGIDTRFCGLVFQT